MKLKVQFDLESCFAPWIRSATQIIQQQPAGSLHSSRGPVLAEQPTPIIAELAGGSVREDSVS